MTRRKPPSDTGPDYDHRVEQARAEGDQEKQAILDAVLASNRLTALENTQDQETA